MKGWVATEQQGWELLRLGTETLGVGFGNLISLLEDSESGATMRRKRGIYSGLET